MTECERLIQEGIFDESFFQEENICDFLVTTKQKKLWAIEIDLLLQIDKICNKYNLKYFLMFGSLIGAIRHKGYIPWDDDMDICMFRDDYEKFLSIAQKKLQYPYFLQIPKTDNDCFISYAKVRNSNTSLIHNNFIGRQMNMGICIDIFPLDTYIKGDSEKNYKIIDKLILENSTFMRMKNKNLSAKDKERIRNYPGGDPLKKYYKIHELATCNNNKKSDKCCSTVCTLSPLDKLTFKTADFENIIYTPFYDFKFPIPSGYNNILKTTYNDYMKYPKIEDRGNWHKDIIIDPDKPYVEYLKKEC